MVVSTDHTADLITPEEATARALRRWRGRVVPLREVVDDLASACPTYPSLENAVSSLLGVSGPPTAVLMATNRTAVISFARASQLDPDTERAQETALDDMRARGQRRLDIQHGSTPPTETLIQGAPLNPFVNTPAGVYRVFQEIYGIFQVALVEAARDHELQGLEDALFRRAESLDRALAAMPTTQVPDDFPAQVAYQAAERERNARLTELTTRVRDRLLALRRSPVHAL